MPQPLELCYDIDSTSLFDIVNTILATFRRGSSAQPGPRSKGQKFCEFLQGLIEWLHPRLHRLGLIEASASPRTWAPPDIPCGECQH